ncbi:MAG: MFS transporter [Eubacterium sp.]|nr:MFS transporter [Eubacterium sp.]
MQNHDEKSLTTRERLIYGISNGGQVIGYSLISSYLMYFYVNVFSVDARVISIIFLIGGIWDIINNPLIGTLIDRKSSSKGKLTRLIRIFTPFQAITTIFIFMGPLFIKNNSPLSSAKVIYLLITYFLWEFFYSITDVSFGGLAAVISQNPIDRQKAISTASICVQLSGSLVLVIIPMILDFSKSGKTKLSMAEIFLIIGIIAGTVGVGIFSLSGYFVKERIVQKKAVQPVKELLSNLIRNKPMLLLLSSNLILSFVGIGEAFSTYYYLDVLGYASLSIIAAAPAFVISIFSYSLIKTAKKHFSNKTILILSNITVGTFQLILFFIGLKHFQNIKVMLPAIILCNCVTGLFGGILNTLPTEMLTEATDYAEWKTGVRMEGVAFSLKNSVVKVYGTLAQGLAAFLLSLIGYVSGQGQMITQSNSVQKNIWIVFSLTPAVIRLICTLPIFFYSITGKEKQQMFNDLKRSRESDIHE